MEIMIDNIFFADHVKSTKKWAITKKSSTTRRSRTARATSWTRWAGPSYLRRLRRRRCSLRSSPRRPAITNRRCLSCPCRWPTTASWPAHRQLSPTWTWPDRLTKILSISVRCWKRRDPFLSRLGCAVFPGLPDTDTDRYITNSLN